MKYLCEFLINHTICICGDCRCCSRLIYLTATMHNYSLFMSFHMPAKTFRFSITEHAFWTIESMTFKCGLISEGILNSARLIKGQFFQKILCCSNFCKHFTIPKHFSAQRLIRVRLMHYWQVFTLFCTSKRLR